MTDKPRPIAGLAHQAYTIELRDLFAMSVLNTLVGIPTPDTASLIEMVLNAGFSMEDNPSIQAMLSRTAYKWADAMLEAREATAG